VKDAVYNEGYTPDIAGKTPQHNNPPYEPPKAQTDSEEEGDRARDDASSTQQP
jgi:hypothetical protein